MSDAPAPLGECGRCGKRLEASWAACPFCGQPLEGGASNERILRIVGKLAGAVSETALLHYERRATREGDAERAEQLEVLRRTVREVTPLLVDAGAEFLAQARRSAARRAQERADEREEESPRPRDAPVTPRVSLR